MANITLPGQNNPGAGADYTDKNIEWYAEAHRIYNEDKAAYDAEKLADLSHVLPGQSQVII